MKNAIEKLQTYISSHCGFIVRDHDLKNFEYAVKKRMESLNVQSIDEYYWELVQGSMSSLELQELINLLTINHTFFFRNRPHFSLLRNTILHVIQDEKIREKNQQVKIWSAGCSTGEEAYSIAMIVSDFFSEDEWDIQILATDIDTEVIRTAQKGIYKEKALKEVNSYFRKTYFTQLDSSHYQIASSLRTLVQFEKLNLCSTPFPEEFDIIFCRNVLIYFNQSTVESILKRFHSSLNHNGFLFLGFSEFLDSTKKLYNIHHSDDAVYYTKKIVSEMNISEISLHAELPSSTAGFSIDSVQPTSGFGFQENDISGTAVDDSKAVEISITHDTSQSNHKEEDLFVEIERAISKKEYASASQLLETAPRNDTSRSKISYYSAHIALAHEQNESAEKKLQESIAGDVLWAPPYYLLGTIALYKKDLEIARSYFQKALYLDTSFVMARFNLAITYQEMAMKDLSLFEFRNCIKFLSNRGYNEIVPFSDNFSVSALITICKFNVERLTDENR